MNEPKKKPDYNFSISWSQVYKNWQSEQQHYNVELERIRIVDNIVDQMTEYPDASRMLGKIFSPK